MFKILFFSKRLYFSMNIKNNFYTKAGDNHERLVTICLIICRGSRDDRLAQLPREFIDSTADKFPRINST